MPCATSTARPPPASRDLGDLAPGEPVSNTSHARYLEMVEAAKEYIRAGDIFQVVPSPALGADVRPAALRALPRAPPDEPLALHVLLQLRRLPGGRRQPRDPRARQGRAPSPSAPSPAPARAAPRRSRTSRSRPSSSPTPRSAPSTSCSSTSAATTSAASRGSARVDPNDVHHRALQPRHAHRLQRRRRARRRPRRALRAPRRPPRRHRLRRAQGPRDADHRRARAEKRGAYGGAVGYFASHGNMDICIALRTAW